MVNEFRKSAASKVENDLKGRRLLLLGGVSSTCVVVEEAHKMGVEVYVTDYLEDSPAKKISDKAFMVSATDVDAVVDLCKREQVDGVFTGYVDSLLPSYVEICSQLGVPCLASNRGAVMSVDKMAFKESCEESNLPVVPWSLLTPENYVSMSKELSYPQVVKPIDNSGSRGVFRCRNASEFVKSCEEAFSLSRRKALLSEKMMDPDNEFSAYYIISDGMPHLAALSDRYTFSVTQHEVPLGNGMRFPSRRLGLWERNVDPAVCEFLSKNEISNGYVFFQGFEEDGRLYIHEMGNRLNGGFTFTLVNRKNGYNQVQSLIHFALTGEMALPVEKINPRFTGESFILNISLSSGTIGSIVGVEALREIDSVVDVLPLKQEGDSVPEGATTLCGFAFVVLSADSLDTLARDIQRVWDILEVRDEKGDDMIIGRFNPERLRG